MTATELRDYVIADGHLDDFVSAWRKGVVPLRRRHGFRIDGAWAIRSERRFIWLVSLDADQAAFSRRNEAYYADPARAALAQADERQRRMRRLATSVGLTERRLRAVEIAPQPADLAQRVVPVGDRR